MKKKKHSSPKQSDSELIRSQTHYKGARAFLGVPFVLAGIILLFPAVAALLSMFGSGRFNPMAIPPFVGCLLASLFCFGISALGNAIFDLADCSIRRDALDRHAAARQAYQEYQEYQAAGQ